MPLIKKYLWTKPFFRPVHVLLKREIYIYGLLTKCEVKMAGYWPSSFSLRAYGEAQSRSINSQKRTRPISSHLDRTNLVNKGFIIWLLVWFCLRDTAGSPERARWLHLARSGSQSQRVIWFILPARGVSHIIKRNMTPFSANESAGISIITWVIILIHIITHQSHYEKSDWSRAFNQFTIACDMINAISAADIALSCLCYLPQPSASADNTDLGFDNSWYHAQPHPIIV